jgi:hypothetical protein
VIEKSTGGSPKVVSTTADAGMWTLGTCCRIVTYVSAGPTGFHFQLTVLLSNDAYTYFWAFCCN